MVPLKETGTLTRSTARPSALVTVVRSPAARQQAMEWGSASLCSLRLQSWRGLGGSFCFLDGVLRSTKGFILDNVQLILLSFSWCHPKKPVPILISVFFLLRVL